MLPLRLSLEGFLSYRDRTEFDFSGARLWMMCGPNGAGKSSVFDALRFVIYGAHRAGKQNAEMLVHHQSARLRVEADLQLGEKVFRLVRTLGRGGARPTWQVRQKVGDEWRDVPETAMKTDYERWVAAHIGLSDEAFCAAVYLSQGHADAILNPDPQARYDLLSQLVDLRVYEGWHERAEERRSLARAALQEARRRWENAPHVDVQELEAKRELSLAFARRRDELGARERELDALKGDATRFDSWQAALQRLAQNADQKRALLGDEADIERDFARLSHLERHLPTVEDLLRLAQSQAQIEGELADLGLEQEKAKHAFEDAESAHVLALAGGKEAQNAVQRAGDSLAVLELERALLSPGEAELERRQKLRDELGVAATKLALVKAPAGEVQTLMSERDEARETARHLPSWRRFIAARETAREESTRWQTATLRALELNAQLAGSRAEHDTATRAVHTQQLAWEGVQALQTRTKTQLDAAQNARRDFARVEGEARCHFCGQELSPEHARAEAERLERELALASTEHERAQNELNAARTARDNARHRLDEIGAELAQNDAEMSHSRLERALHLQKRDDALSQARAALDELNGARQNVWAEDSLDFALASARPGADELARWQAEAARLPKREWALTQAQTRERERESLGRECERLKRDLAPLDAKWNDETTRQWRARWNALDDERKAARREQEQGRANAKSQENLAQQCSERSLAARLRREELTGRIGPLEGEERALRRQLETCWPPVQAAIEGDSALATGADAAGAKQNALFPATEWDDIPPIEQNDGVPPTEQNLLIPTIERDALTFAIEWNETLEERVLAGERALQNDGMTRILDVLQVVATNWKEELRSLQGRKIGERQGELAQARAELERLQNEAAFLTRAIGDLPEAARRPASELMSELSGTRDELELVRLETKGSELEVAQAQGELAERARAQSEMQTREQEHNRWSELARLLGPRQLQRHLLREAERGIVREANSVLEAISGGTLRLELLVEGEEGSSKVPKVLDVECHHLSGGALSRPVSPAFLSGSQRFRVAVALALGIGRTAARGAGDAHSGARVEAILIDEGFGSLDRVGRDEMKDELRVLGRELGRIILVSHQEDFAQGFPARFDISMEEGVSRARRVVE